MIWLPNSIQFPFLSFLDSLLRYVTSTLSGFLLSLGCSLASILNRVLSLFVLSSQMALIFPWLSSSLCQQCPHLYFWPKPFPVCPLDDSTGTSHRHFKLKMFESLPHLYTPLIYLQNLYGMCHLFLSLQDHPSFNYSFSLIWISNSFPCDLHDTFAPFRSSLHTAD